MLRSFMIGLAVVALSLAASPALAETTYTIVVKTADKPDAGTDSEMEIRLVSSTPPLTALDAKLDAGKTVVTIPLSKEHLHGYPTPVKPIGDPKNRLERGKTDTYVAHGQPEVGQLEKIELITDNREPHSGWLMESVEVTDEKSQKKWTFKNTNGWWIGGDGDDTPPIREFFPAP